VLLLFKFVENQELKKPMMAPIPAPTKIGTVLDMVGAMSQDSPLLDKPITPHPILFPALPVFRDSASPPNPKSSLS
jgi:hypothetical protein